MFRSCLVLGLKSALTTLLFSAMVVVPASAQLYTADKAGLVDAIHDYKINSWWESILVDRTFDFRLSDGCFKRMVDKEDWGIKTAANAASAVGEYFKKMGWGDLEASESANNNDRDNNKPRIVQMIDEAKGHLHFTLVADKITCTSAQWDLVHRLWQVPFEALENGTWKPPHQDVFLTFTFSPTAKDISVSVNPDGKHFDVTAPCLVEPSDWDQKIIKGLNRVPSATPAHK